MKPLPRVSPALAMKLAPLKYADGAQSQALYGTAVSESIGSKPPGGVRRTGVAARHRRSSLAGDASSQPVGIGSKRRRTTLDSNVNQPPRIAPRTPADGGIVAHTSQLVPEESVNSLMGIVHKLRREKFHGLRARDPRHRRPVVFPSGARNYKEASCARNDNGHLFLGQPPRSPDRSHH